MNTGTTVSRPCKLNLSEIDNGSRLVGLDALRAFVMMIGVLFHVVEASMAHRPAYAVTEAFLMVSRAWRMPIFFLMAGFFIEISSRKNTAGRVFKRRLQRIGLPLLAGLILLLPPNWFFHIAYQDLAKGTLDTPWTFSFLSNTILYRLEKPRLHHLWFLYYLIGFSTVWLGLKNLSVEKKYERLAGRVITFASLGIFIICLILKHQPYYRGRTDSLTYQPVEILYYLPFFLWGNQMTRIAFPRDERAVGRLVLILILIAAAAGSAVMGSGLSLALYDFFYAIFVLSGVALLPLIFQSKIKNSSRGVRFLTRASYWTYLVHEPLVFAAGTALQTYRWNAPAEIFLNAFVVYVLSLLSFAVFVEGTRVDKFLNGHNQPK